MSPQRAATSLALALALVLAAAPGRAADPVPVPGWRMELVAAAPTVRCPSVVACAPDGRVFVAEDPMDLTRPADVAEGRILCRHPDGRWTVYAEHLHAVFGMQYLEGRLLVLHNPRFTAFADAGDHAGAPEELVTRTNPNPWALDWNDHVPANFKLAMDGFLYVAVGDKGLYHATGRDGRTVDLHGGGVVRIRPDGTGLEVFSTGVRNILDVAMTSEDELFTYDNTDENQWMGRVTHMVDGGFYGYPFDFIPRRPYTLWMLADYGAGAATGTTAVTGDALPAEYRDNLLLADFGQRNVRRVVLERRGGTFAPRSDSQLFSDVPPDFRPVGIAFSDDGRSLYVCDWQHRDTKENAVTGRLWRLSWTGPDGSRPRPAWYRDAAMGRPVAESVGTLASALGHPSRAVRLAAQRALARRGRDAAPTLEAIVRADAAPAFARIHALWALDAVDRGVSARDALLGLARGTDPVLARQALRQLGESRAPVASRIAPLLRSADASVRFHAATALGHIGHPEAVDGLVAAAGDDDLFARHAAFMALRRIGTASPGAWPRIVAGLGSADARVREGVGFALRDVLEEPLARALADAAGRAADAPEARVRALGSLAELHHRAPEWQGDWWAYHPFRLAPPARTNDWAGTPVVRAALVAALADPAPAVRIAAAAGLGRFGTADAGGALLARHGVETDATARTAMLDAIAATRPPGAGRLAARLVRDNPPGDPIAEPVARLARSFGGPEVVAALVDAAGAAGAGRRSLDAIALLGELGARDAVPALARLARSGESPAPARVAATRALGRIGGDDAGPAVAGLIADAALPVRVAAIESLPAAALTNAVPALLAAWRDDGTKAVAATALLRVPDARALDAYLGALGSRSAAVRASARAALRPIRSAVLPALEPRAAALSPDVVAELQQVYRGDAAAAGTALMRRDVGRPDREAFLAFGLANPGNADHGRALFKDTAGVACIRCHRVQGDGASIGPDLSGAGAQFDRRALAESILWPNRAVREGYNVVELTLDDGEVVAGMIRGETAGTLVVQPAAGDPVTLDKARIKSRASTAQSLMPEGLEGALSLEDFADLLAYLSGLRSGT